VWRELERPENPRVETWPVQSLHGFGLLQHDRNKAHYADAEAKYERRPSVWIEPAESWGPGRVELLELPAEHEGHDNIGAYWVSDKPVEAGTGPRLRYRITFGDHLPSARQMAQVAENQ
jgi:glucans biosynthesis protein